MAVGSLLSNFRNIFQKPVSTDKPETKIEIKIEAVVQIG